MDKKVLGHLFVSQTAKSRVIKTSALLSSMYLAHSVQGSWPLNTLIFSDLFCEKSKVAARLTFYKLLNVDVKI